MIGHILIASLINFRYLFTSIDAIKRANSRQRRILKRNFKARNWISLLVPCSSLFLHSPSFVKKSFFLLFILTVLLPAAPSILIFFLLSSAPFLAILFGRGRSGMEESLMNRRGSEKMNNNKWRKYPRPTLPVFFFKFNSLDLTFHFKFTSV